MADEVIRAAQLSRVIDPEHDDPIKGQLVRLAEVFVLGPYLIYTSRGIDHRYLRAGMLLLGIGSIIYNGYNLLRVYKAQRGEGIPELAGRPIMGSRARGLRAPGIRELDSYSVNIQRTPRSPRERRIW